MSGTLLDEKVLAPRDSHGRLATSLRWIHGDPKYQPRHVDCRVVGHPVVAVRGGRIEPRVGNDMEPDVTMKEPVAGAIRTP